jgi:hypothetical protein
MGIFEINIAMNPIQVASIAYITAGPGGYCYQNGPVERSFPGFFIEPGMELDPVIDT